MDIALAPDEALPATATGKAQPKSSDIRIPELDGLRGLMTLFVLYSHYFVEVPHGIGVFYVGWVAVIAFFVLSGYLIGRLIIEKHHAGNFLRVFYLRRICRMFPSYILVSAVLLWLGARLADRPWMAGPPPLPAWSYFVFGQNFFMLTRGSVGLHWIAPTWTLALEEQFYILAPFLFLLTPRRRWIPMLTVLCLGGLALRTAGVFAGVLGVTPLGLLPMCADVVSVGLLLAVLVKEGLIDWQRWSGYLRVAPIICLVIAALIQRIDGTGSSPWFQAFDPFLVALTSAFFILMLVKGAPEARRFQSRVLRFFGDISYNVYLTHLFVLALMHGLILGSAPDTATPSQLLVTVAAVPVAIGLAWIMTTTLEQPITAWGRSFRWH